MTVPHPLIVQSASVLLCLDEAVVHLLGYCLDVVERPEQLRVTTVGDPMIGDWRVRLLASAETEFA
jgi:hypothetical protein